MDVIAAATPSTIGLYLGLGLALVTLCQAALMAVIAGAFAARKERRDSARTLEAARLMAELKSAEKAEDWRRQDIVAERVAQAAQQADRAAERAATERQQLLDRTGALVGKADGLITATAKIHELTNSTNQELQKALAVSATEIKGLHELIAAMLVTKQETASVREATDRQTAAALVAPSPGQMADVQAVLNDPDAWERERQANRPHTQRSGDPPAYTAAVVASLEAIDAHTKGIEENTTPTKE